MFYERQSEASRDNYKKTLEAVGKLSKLFSDSDKPYLYYRCHENIFCKCFNVENVSRSDDSIDAKAETIGIGLKTWINNDNQKIAEFNKVRKNYCNLNDLDLVKEISNYRNKRIQFCKSAYNIGTMIYHIVKRYPGAMKIFEHSFDEIDVDNIGLLKEKSKISDNTIYFTDGNHEYSFNKSKSTLYMAFEGMEELDSFEVEILEDPFSLVMELVDKSSLKSNLDIIDLSKKSQNKPQICLRLYSIKKGEKFVPERSGLNQWNANGRKRDFNEVYIPYPSEDRKRNPDFFPPRDTPFILMLPDGTKMSAKICQEDGKAIMSNPNKQLGEWLLRKVFNLKEGDLLTYDMLNVLDVDSVIFTKEEDKLYSIDFSRTGTYEDFYN